MIEVELKSVVDEVERRRVAIETAGAKLVFSGRLEDRRFDTPDRSLMSRDHVLRVRVYRDAHTTRAQLDWKGPTRYDDGYKLREELEARVADADALVAILGQLGYVVTIAIDREIEQYELDGAMIRFERYPRMDDLVEVEGSPEQIERAIAALGLPRAGFTSERLPDFASRFEARTGTRAALSHGALAGDDRFDLKNA
jgi:predicted adenylyl cyclase CyaB